MLIGRDTITFIIFFLTNQVDHFDVIFFITMSIILRSFGRIALSLFFSFCLRSFLTRIFALMRRASLFSFSLGDFFTLLRDLERRFWMRGLWRHFCSIFRLFFFCFLERGRSALVIWLFGSPNQSRHIGISLVLHQITR